MTIDKLAIIVAKSFDSLEKNMATKTDIEGLKNQISGVNNRIDDISMNRVKYEDFNKLKTRVGVLEEKFKQNF